MDFARLRRVNRDRSDRWHPAGLHSWSLSDWAIAFMGEAGEVCNVIKKMNRLRDGLVGNQGTDADIAELKRKLGHEIADTVIYLDLLAQREGIVLEEAIIEKFNIVSERNMFPERL